MQSKKKLSQKFQVLSAVAPVWLAVVCAPALYGSTMPTDSGPYTYIEQNTSAHSLQSADGGYNTFSNYSDAAQAPDSVQSASSGSQVYSGSIDHESAEASAAVSVDYGSLHLLTQAAAQREYPDRDHGSDAGADAYVSWHDSFTPTSTSLPVGTSFQFRLGLSLHAVLSQSVVYATSGTPSTDDSAIPLAEARVFYGQGNDGSGLVLDTKLGDGKKEMQTANNVFTAKVGEPITLWADLSGHSGGIVLGEGVSGASDILSASKSTDAGNTSYVTLEMLTPDVSYTSDSGTTYLTSFPAPEPAAGGLLASVVGAGLLRRRQRIGEQ